MKIIAAAMLTMLMPIASAAELVVNVDGIKSREKGELIVQLFKGEKTWMELDRVLAEQVVKVDGRSMSIVFDGLELGDDYAISIIHDANGNGEMDMRWFPFPKPKEGVGLSNNKFSMGQPSFDDAQFALSAEQQEIKLKLKYY